MIKTYPSFKWPLVFFFIVLLLPAGCITDNDHLVTISPKEAHTIIEKMTGDKNFVILDIRTPKEYKAGHISNAVLLDYYSKTFVDKLKLLDKDKTYLIYCRSANRSGKTLEIIKNMGFKKVYNMGRGIKGWLKSGYQLVK